MKIESDIPFVSDRRLNPLSPQKIAERDGLVRFFTGKPCLNGHIAERYTKGGQCVQCIVDNKIKNPNSRQRSRANTLLARQAHAAFNTTYVPDKPCKNGHLLRFVNSNNCVECDVEARERRKIASRFIRIKKEYGLSKEQYLALVEDQRSCCKLCGVHVENHFALHIDHCHERKIVRSLLCNKCNQGIGLLQHSPELLRKAAAYCEAAQC